MAILKTLTVNGVTYKVATPVPVVNVTLNASAWVASDSRYSQVVSIPGVTPKSQVNLTPSVEQIEIFYEKNITFVTENDGGNVTVYVIGQKPENNYTMPVKIVEVVTDSKKIYGSLVTTPINPEKLTPSDVVKTVNGVAPDENGNVEVENDSVSEEQITSAVGAYLEEHPVEGGLTQDEKQIMLTLFKNIAYTSDMSNTVKRLETLWSGGGGNDDLPEDLPDPIVAYEVINNLSHVTNSNNATTASGYYSATLSTEDGYVISVTITMGGVDITDSVYTEDGTILIPEVTGDIVITATAELAPIPVLYQLANTPRTVNADLYADTGLTFGSNTANGYTDNWTLCVDVIATSLSKHAFCVATSDNTRCIGFTTNGAGAGLIYVCNNSSVTILNNDEKRYKFVITHAANADKKATVHRIVDGAVVSTEVSASYGAFNNSVYAASLFVGGKTAAEFVGTFNEFTIYNKVLSDAHIAEFLGVV